MLNKTYKRAKTWTYVEYLSTQLLSSPVLFLCFFRFDNELTQALEEADNEREQKDKASQENAALGAEIYALRRSLQVSFTKR